MTALPPHAFGLPLPGGAVGLDIEAAFQQFGSSCLSLREAEVVLAAAEHHKAIRRRVAGAVDLWDIATDDLWTSDSGPSFVVDGKGGLVVTQFNFNGWGAKHVHGNDGTIAVAVAERLGLPHL